jgi:hypothetical protein
MLMWMTTTDFNIIKMISGMLGGETGKGKK